MRIPYENGSDGYILKANGKANCYYGKRHFLDRKRDVPFNTVAVMILPTTNIDHRFSTLCDHLTQMVTFLNLIPENVDAVIFTSFDTNLSDIKEIAISENDRNDKLNVVILHDCVGNIQLPVLLDKKSIAYEDKFPCNMQDDALIPVYKGELNDVARTWVRKYIEPFILYTKAIKLLSAYLFMKPNMQSLESMLNEEPDEVEKAIRNAQKMHEVIFEDMFEFPIDDEHMTTLLELTNIIPSARQSIPEIFTSFDERTYPLSDETLNECDKYDKFINMLNDIEFLWRTQLEKACVPFIFKRQNWWTSPMDFSLFKDILHLVGADSVVEAYLSGIPIRDIVA